MREEIIRRISEQKLIVIVRGIDLPYIVPLTEALYKGGIRLVEVTFDQTKKCPDEETCRKITAMNEAFGDKMDFGAGTVLTPEQVKMAHDAGARFIISPDTNEDVIKCTRSLGMVSIPGAYTPTEIVNADRYGADFVKLFPASNGGLAYYKALTAPLAHIKLLYVGGVTLETAAELSKGGVIGFGIGGAIINKTAVLNGDYDIVTKTAAAYLAAVHAS